MFYGSPFISQTVLSCFVVLLVIFDIINIQLLSETTSNPPLSSPPFRNRQKMIQEVATTCWTCRWIPTSPPTASATKSRTERWLGATMNSVPSSGSTLRVSVWPQSPRESGIVPSVHWSCARRTSRRLLTELNTYYYSRNDWLTRAGFIVSIRW